MKTVSPLVLKKSQTSFFFIALLIGLTGCKSGLQISQTKVPFGSICGSNAKYKCRATGFGDNRPTYRIMEKERPSADGKSAGSNLFHLGRGADLVEWNNTVEALLLNQSDYSVDTVKVNYDLKNNNASKILSDLNSTLKSEKINLDIAAQIKDNFEHTLNSDLVIEAYVITYTINFDLLDSIRKAANGRPSGMRFKLAAENLKAAKKPLIREVKVIEERCQFRNSTSLKNILEPILKLKLGNENPKVNLVLNATLSKERTSVFSSSYRRTSLYSYGYFNDKWMMQ